MLMNFPAFGAWTRLAAGALTALSMKSMLRLALADEIDESRQLCDNLKADPDERIPACTRLLEAGRKDVDLSMVYRVRGNVWYLKGNFDNAISDYQAAVNHNPKLISALQGLGNSYFRKAEFRPAIKAYSDALAVEKKSAELYNNRGLAQLNIGEFSSAVKDFSEAIKLNSKFVSALNNRGIAYSKYKQSEPAIKDFTKAVEIEPNFVDAYMSRAEVLIVEKGDLDGGIKDYDKAISLDPKNWKGYSARGEVASAQGRARSGYDRPRRGDPPQSEPRNPTETEHLPGRPKEILIARLLTMTTRSCSTPTMRPPMRPAARL